MPQTTEQKLKRQPKVGQHPAVRVAPFECADLDAVCRLNRDNFDTNEGWIITDGATVTVTRQKPGEPATGKCTLPRKDFNALVRWYLRKQKCKRA